VRLGHRVPIGNQIGFFLHQSVLRCFENTSSVKGWTPRCIINPNAVPPIYGRISTNQLQLETKWLKTHTDELIRYTIMDYYLLKQKAKQGKLLPKRQPYFSGQYEFEDFAFLFDFNHLPTEMKHGIQHSILSLRDDMVYQSDNLKHLNQKRKENNSSESSLCEDRKPAAKRR
jgi:hypothetical protein